MSSSLTNNISLVFLSNETINTSLLLSSLEEDDKYELFSNIIELLFNDVMNKFPDRVLPSQYGFMDNIHSAGLLFGIFLIEHSKSNTEISKYFIIIIIIIIIIYYLLLLIIIIIIIIYYLLLLIKMIHFYSLLRC